MSRQKLISNAKGFTIVELLISSLVFSVVLLAVTIGIIQITRVYYKGMTESTTQNATRTALDTITQAIQFNGGDVSQTTTTGPGTWTSFCVGTQQFSYRLGYQLVDGTAGTYQTNKAMLQTSLPGCAGNPAAAASGRELLGPKMRLSNLKVSSVGDNLYKVTIRVVYGDNDLLFSPSNPSAANGSTLPDAKCKGATAGSQFCSVSELTTTVVKRVQ